MLPPLAKQTVHSNDDEAPSGEVALAAPRRTLRPSAPASLPAEELAGDLCIRVRRGVDRGRSCRLLGTNVGIGSSPISDLTLHDPCVSRSHCQITVEDGQYVLRDLGSTNGTYVDGVPIVEAILSSASVIQLGDSELTLETVAAAERRESDCASLGGMVGNSEVMRELFSTLRSVAETPLTCLILGETGTGKELAARALHDQSPRRDRPFIVVDCAAVGAQFIEDKLFGHTRGAFTGAHEAVPGVFEAARGGTVFLDEIGELPIALQPKLLGVLERREATRIGSHVPVKLDVRVVAATHRDLRQMVNGGTFRQDLLHRLREFTVRIAALRERPDDIAPIARAILEREGSSQRLSEDALAYLRHQPWPGNVRELRNRLRSAAFLAKGPTLDRALLASLEPIPSAEHEDGDPPTLAGRALAAEPDALASALSFEAATEAFRARYVRSLRARFGSDLQGAAAFAGMHPKSVSRLFRLYGV